MNGDGIGGLRVSAGYRIEAAFAEGMAAGKAAQRHPRAAHRPETDHSNIGILRAGRQIKALRRAEGMQNGRNDGLIDPEGNANGDAGWGFGHNRTA